jgi:hypothetical protein
MKHYISPTNELYAYEEDGSQDNLIPSNFTLITKAEADARQMPQLSGNDLIKLQIYNLEATITPRRLREATLSPDGLAWLTTVDAQIAALRAQLV